MKTIQQEKDRVIASVVDRLKSKGVTDIDRYLNNPEEQPNIPVQDIYNHEHDMGVLEGLNRSQDLSPQDVSASKLLEQMTTGIAHFSFMKIDNTERVAYGTVNPQLIPAKGSEKFEDMKALLKDLRTYFDTSAAMQPAESKAAFMTLYERTDLLTNVFSRTKPERAKAPDVIVYFDLEKREWRSCKIASLLKVF